MGVHCNNSTPPFSWQSNLGGDHMDLLTTFSSYSADFIPGLWCGQNDGGVKRGDRADTGDEKAQPTKGVGRDGSGVRGGANDEKDQGGSSGHPTADPSSQGGGSA